MEPGSGANDVRLPAHLMWAGILMGLGLAGFLDGIVLHQILQWHHLLSGLQTGALGSLRGQIMADGLFHAAMYLIVALGMGLVWSRRSAVTQPGAGQWIFAYLLLGFGAWHIFDGIVVHWLLGLHRTNPAIENPLVWDLLFLGVGAVSLGAGLIIRQRPRGPGKKGTVKAIVASILVAGVCAAIPWRSGSAVTVVFGPDKTASAVLAAALAADARMVWTDTHGVWVFTIDRPENVLTLYRHGAWLVTGAYSATGCYAPTGI